MKRLFLVSLITLLSAALLYPTAGKEINVTGKVVDTTGTGIAGAIVLLTADAEAVNNPLDSNINIDTAFSGSDGSFTKTMTVTDNALLLFYAVAKKDYKLKISFGTINPLSNTAALGTIELEKETFITVTFKGTVKDSVTGVPIQGAVVLLSDMNSMIDSSFDSVTTDANGYFEMEREIGEGDTGILAPRGFFITYANGYEVKFGAETADQGVIDFGDILLKKQIDPIIYTPTPSAINKTPNAITVYTLNGQVVYRGKEINPAKALTHKHVQSQPLIVHFKRGNTVLYNRIIIHIH